MDDGRRLRRLMLRLACLRGPRSDDTAACRSFSWWRRSSWLVHPSVRSSQKLSAGVAYNQECAAARFTTLSKSVGRYTASNRCAPRRAGREMTAVRLRWRHKPSQRIARSSTVSVSQCMSTRLSSGLAAYCYEVVIRS